MIILHVLDPGFASLPFFCSWGVGEAPEAIMHDPVPGILLQDRIVINKICETLRDNEKGADLTQIMQRANNVFINLWRRQSFQL